MTAVDRPARLVLHVVVADTFAAGVDYCRTAGLPAGRYDRSQPAVTVEIVTPAGGGRHLLGRSFGRAELHWQLPPGADVDAGLLDALRRLGLSPP